MMTSPVGGIDPHQDSYTVGVVDANGVELTHAIVPDERRRLLSTGSSC